MDGLDGPVAAVEGEQALGVSGVRGVAGDAVGVFDGALAGFLDGDGAFDEERLSDMGECQVVVEAFGGPDGAAFDAPVREAGRFAEVGFAAFSEEGFDVVEQGGLVGLDGEQVVGAALAEAVRELALGEQGVGGEGCAGDIGVQAVEQGEDGADFVGAFGFVVGADGEPVDFF